MNRPSVITIGNFDGVHLGHRAILDAAHELARPSQARVIAMTFDPMPVAILRPGAGPPHLGTIAQRVDALKRAGADEVVVIEPTQEVLSQDAVTFIESLINQYHAVGFVEGQDFRFGHKRSGDMAMLKQLGEERGFAVKALSRVEVRLSDQSLAPVSSSLVRWLIGRGRVEDAATCLGRPYELRGTIVRGDQRGRTIGVPTANLDSASWRGLITPMDGVYAGSVSLDGDSEEHPAAISVGVKPTFGQDHLQIEAHLIGVTTQDPDAFYGKKTVFRFARWVRDQYPFPSITELTAQLQRDISQCREVLASLDADYD